MEKIVFEGVELQFGDFSKEIQEKLYVKSREKFEKHAAISQFAEIRRLVVKNEQTTSTALDEVFRVEMEKYEDFENVGLLKQHPNFQLSDEKRKKIAEAEFWEIRILAAEDETSSSEFLNQMLRDEIEFKNDSDVIAVILNNPNFKMEEQTREKLARSDNEEYRQIAAEHEGSSAEFLNKMLKDEIECGENSNVIEAILGNNNFKMDDNARIILAKSNDWEKRVLVAEDSQTSSEILNQMIRDETKGKNDGDVIDAILENENFEMDDETRDLFASLDDSSKRMLVAENKKTSSEYLNQMLKAEIEGEEDDDVVETILNNPNFEMKAEIRKLFANAENYEYRKIVAKEKGTSRQLLEMMYLEEDDEEVIEEIEKNLLKKHKKSISLTVIQEHEILKALKELKVSRTNTSILECMEKILEIIG